MYKLDSFCDVNNEQTFMKLLTTKWDEVHEHSDIFRYKMNKPEERLVDEKYLLQLNPDRQSKRRAPEEMTNICQPFDTNKFNFTKVCPKEVLFSIEDDGDVHSILVNVSPISRYHSLLCPSINQCLPQVVTSKSLELSARIMFLAQDRNLRIGFNSMCAFASVNHLHYHLFFETNDLFVETVKWRHLRGILHCLDSVYPIPAFCFEIPKHSIENTCKQIYEVLKYLLNKCIGHNIMLHTRGETDAVKIIIWPRRNTQGAKQLAAFNVAVLELAGWFPIYDPDDFKTLQREDLEAELLKWKRDDFENLCEEIQDIIN